MQWNPPYLRSAKFLILRWSFQGGLRSGFHCMLHPCINRYVIYMKTELTGFPGGPMGPGSPGVPSGPGNPGSPDFPSLPSLPGSPCRQNHNLFLCSKLFRNFYDVPKSTANNNTPVSENTWGLIYWKCLKEHVSYFWRFLTEWHIDHPVHKKISLFMCHWQVVT